MWQWRSCRRWRKSSKKGWTGLAIWQILTSSNEWRLSWRWIWPSPPCRVGGGDQVDVGAGLAPGVLQSLTWSFTIYRTTIWNILIVWKLSAVDWRSDEKTGGIFENLFLTDLSGTSITKTLIFNCYCYTVSAITLVPFFHRIFFVKLQISVFWEQQRLGM